MGCLTPQFKAQWDSILYETELNLVRLLYAESISLERLLHVEYEEAWSQIEEDLSGDVVAGWSYNIEKKAKKLEEELAEKRFKKWELWTGELDSTTEGLPRIEDNDVLEITDVEQSMQQRENDEVREQLIRNRNQCKNLHNNGGKQKNGEEITGDVQARSHGFVSENVVNLSNRVLTSDEIQVLSRGLNFCPAPKKY